MQTQRQQVWRIGACLAAQTPARMCHRLPVCSNLASRWQHTISVQFTRFWSFVIAVLLMRKARDMRKVLVHDVSGRWPETSLPKLVGHAGVQLVIGMELKIAWRKMKNRVTRHSWQLQLLHPQFALVDLHQAQVTRHSWHREGTYSYFCALWVAGAPQCHRHQRR